MPVPGLEFGSGRLQSFLEFFLLSFEAIVGSSFFRGSNKLVAFSDRMKNCQHGVVIFLADWIELVIVAASATYRQPQEHLRRRGDHIMQFFVFVFCKSLVTDGGSIPAESGRDP